MSAHVGPPRPPAELAIPEPSFAERARTLLHQARAGSLATLARTPAGHPFASLMPYASDDEGRPLLLISSMAVHTQNLAGDARASLLVTQPDLAGEPLAGGRVTLMGEARRVPPVGIAGTRAAYLARHPNAASWVDFEDFAFFRLEVDHVYFVGGFAAMGWVDAGTYRAARPDPLADAASGIIEHMNRNHPDALVEYARFFAGAEADEAAMTGVDRLGFKLRLRQARRRWSVRIAFPAAVEDSHQTRTVLIEMLQRARAGR